jgi:RNA polymerase sigma-70 factor (ECF subfamily)
MVHAGLRDDSTMTRSVVNQDMSGVLNGVLTDDLAFRAWYEATLPQVYAYLFHRCGRDQALAEELTQQTFVDAIRTHGRTTAEDPVKWLIGVARHRLADHFRALERRERGFLRLVARSDRPAVTWVGVREPDDDLSDALRRLPAAQRAAIVLRYVDDQPVREVGRLLGRSESAVESLLSRGRENLRRALGDEP